MPSLDPHAPIKLVIRSREKTLFEGNVHAVSSFNRVGPFDVLPFHAHFISVIQQGISFQTDSESKSFEFNTGVMRVADNVIKVFLQK